MNTGDPDGRTMNNRHAGVRAPIVVMKRVTTVERRECRKVSEDWVVRGYQHCASARRAKQYRVKSLLLDEPTERRTHSRNKGWSREGLPHASRITMFCLTEKGAIPESVHCQLESRMREICLSGSVGGAAQSNALSLPLSFQTPFT